VIAVGSAPADNPPDQRVQGTILSISHVTGDLLLSLDEGTVLVLYGIDRDRLWELAAGDRVTLRLGGNAEVQGVDRIDLQAGGR
jgi:hypothetical protein